MAGLGYHVVTANNGERSFSRPVIRLGLRLALCRRGTTVILQNPDDRDLLLASGIVSPDGFVLIRGSGVDLSEHQASTDPPEPPVGVMAWRMLWTKGVREFVEAARLLRQESVSGCFVLVGDTDLDNPDGIPRRRLAEWRDSGVVEWWGYRSDMPEVLASSHIVCLPTMYGEGVPRVLPEEAAFGKPIVATEAPGYREVVRHGENGLLVPGRVPNALAKALRAVIEHPKTRAEMGSRGRSIAEREFSVEPVVEDT